MLQLNPSENNQDSVDSTRQQQTVLVIDDNDQVRNVLVEILRDQSFKVVSLADSRSAFDTLAEAAPDLILCDIMMPEQNGYEFFDAVRKRDGWSDVPFVFLTALSDPNEIRTAKSIGCDDFITKPFSTEDLLAVINGKLTLAKHRKAAIKAEQNRYRKRIIHTLSHEFRTPLVSINTGTELLLQQKDALDAEQMQKLLGSIYRGGQRLQSLVDDFMLLQQIDSGSAKDVYDRFHAKHLVGPLIERAVESFLERFAETGELKSLPAVEIDNSLAESTNIDCYDVHFNNIIERLLMNAAKFSPEGSTVHVESLSDEDSVVVRIKDCGPGMDKERFTIACEVFHQIDREKLEQQGCGVGLTICHYFACLNGGQLLWMPSEPNHGLTVELRFSVVK